MSVFVRRLMVARAVRQRSISTKKRFYDEVSIKGESGKYYIQLDGRTIKTPLKQDLFAPTRKLASVVATEWQTQQSVISPEKMHITALCNTCIDNPRKKTKEEIVEEILIFLHSDTLCAQVPSEESELMAELQKEKWDPILHWFNKRYKVKMLVSTDIFGVEQNRDTVENIRYFLSKLNIWQLTGLQFAVDSIKSFVVPIAVVDKHISIENAMYLSRLETEVQIQKWGSVEWYHDVEYSNQKGSLSAGTLFYHLCSKCNNDTLL